MVERVNLSHQHQGQREAQGNHLRRTALQGTPQGGLTVSRLHARHLQRLEQTAAFRRSRSQDLMEVAPPGEVVKMISSVDSIVLSMQEHPATGLQVTAAVQGRPNAKLAISMDRKGLIGMNVKVLEAPLLTPAILEMSLALLVDVSLWARNRCLALRHLVMSLATLRSGSH